MRREIVKASAEHEKRFRETFELREDLRGDPVWMMAYEHAATCKLYPDELNAIGAALVRKKNPSSPRGQEERTMSIPKKPSHYVMPFQVRHFDSWGPHQWEVSDRETQLFADCESKEDAELLCDLLNTVWHEPLTGG